MVHEFTVYEIIISHKFILLKQGGYLPQVLESLLASVQKITPAPWVYKYRPDYQKGQ